MLVSNNPPTSAVPDAAQMGGTLPDTGRSTAVPAIGGLALLTVGAILVIAARRNTREVER